MGNKKYKMIGLPTPKESNVYSQLIAKQPYDSFGVERVYQRQDFYKHTIPSGLE